MKIIVGGIHSTNDEKLLNIRMCHLLFPIIIIIIIIINIVIITTT